MIEIILSGSLVGLSLGLTGGGGSILAVPLLLGVVGLGLRDAVTVSLAGVGLTALYGALLQRHQVRWGAGALLGLGGVAGAPLGASLGASWPESLTLGLFALLMLFIAWKMWGGTNSSEVPLSFLTCRADSAGQLNFQWSCAGKLVAAGALTGVLSGIFGVGGGFLVVPALVLVTAMPMPAALATSLIGIFLISGAALVANLVALPTFPTDTAGWFLLGGAVGMTGGSWGKSLLSPALLRRIFAVTLVFVALWVAVRSWNQPATERESLSIEFRQSERLETQGREAAQMLFRHLMNRLEQAMADGGVVGAMNICQSDAQTLTGQTAEALNEKGIASIRRIGLRTRNPKNAQDGIDALVLRVFSKNWKRGDASSLAGQVVFLPQTGETRYYHPVPVAASCLACHGSNSDITPDVAHVLAELYPEDQAVNFAPGDLRGAIVVTFEPGPSSEP